MAMQHCVTAPLSLFASAFLRFRGSSMAQRAAAGAAVCVKFAQVVCVQQSSAFLPARGGSACGID